MSGLEGQVGRVGQGPGQETGNWKLNKRGYSHQSVLLAIAGSLYLSLFLTPSVAKLSWIASGGRRSEGGGGGGGQVILAGDHDSQSLLCCAKFSRQIINFRLCLSVCVGPVLSCQELQISFSHWISLVSKGNIVAKTVFPQHNLMGSIRQEF